MTQTVWFKSSLIPRPLDTSSVSGDATARRSKNADELVNKNQS